MDIEEFIEDAIFSEKDEHRCFYMLIWESFKEIGYAITDEEGYEIDAIIKAVSLQNLLGEFVYRLYDEINETGFEDVLDYCESAGYGEEEILEYCKSRQGIEVDEEDFELTVKNALDYVTETSADKMLEEFSADDLFDYMFTATYAFEQDFTFDFEDSEELQAFIETNHEQLDNYKEEYPSVMSWVEGGMIC
ncbi:MAG: hypothetical protein PUE08_08370 [Eubacteriales bacterium]|nr:hypothetical protein [Eubacteriales bacterium]